MKSQKRAGERCRVLSIRTFRCTSRPLVRNLTFGKFKIFQKSETIFIYHDGADARLYPLNIPFLFYKVSFIILLNIFSLLSPSTQRYSRTKAILSCINVGTSSIQL